jgi:Zn-dependent membrane protease YugP
VKQAAKRVGGYGFVQLCFCFGKLTMLYFVFVIPAMLLALGAQWLVRTAYNRSGQIPARMSGAAAARKILDANGLQHVPIEVTHGYLSDHYDPSTKVVRLSEEVFQGHSMTAVGIAAHEVGHAIQDARNYLPLVLRNVAVPVAGFGGSLSQVFLMAAMGLMFAGQSGLAAGAMLLFVIGFSATVLFQIINLPVEFNASSRAKTELVSLGIVNGQELAGVSKVLNAAALTYVAGTLQTIATLAYYIFQFVMISGMGSQRDE